jgi:hypothetical protein
VAGDARRPLPTTRASARRRPPPTTPGDDGGPDLARRRGPVTASLSSGGMLDLWLFFILISSMFCMNFDFIHVLYGSFKNRCRFLMNLFEELLYVCEFVGIFQKLIQVTYEFV